MALSSMPRRRQATRQSQPDGTPRLLRGMFLAWLAVVALVVACTLIGLNWNFRRGTDGLPTAVLSLRMPSTQPGAAPQTAPVYPTALPTATLVSTRLPGVGTSIPQAAALPNQDTSFGYGIEALLTVGGSSALDRIQELQMGWIKYTVHWSQLEPEAGQINWSDLDAVIQSASLHNLKILLTITDAPNWARSVTVKGKIGPPDNAQNYAKIITLILQRYPNGISAIELWDQENLDQNWYAPGNLGAASYLNLLIPASQAIRQVAPGVIIISGALAPTGKNDGITAIDDFRYMQDMIDGKLLDYVDCVGVHHTGFNLPPTLSAEDAFSGGMPPGTLFSGPYDTSNPVNPHHSWSFYSTLNGYHNMVVAAGRETPLCVTQFGWASADGLPMPPPEFLFARDISEDEQAKYIVRAFHVMREWNFVRLAVLYNLDFAAKPQPDQSEGAAFFSILKPSGAPRQAYLALRDMPKPP